MANNRLWLVDQSSAERVLFAESCGDGWGLAIEADRLNDWLGDHDLAASFANCAAPSALQLTAEQDGEASNLRQRLVRALERSDALLRLAQAVLASSRMPGYGDAQAAAGALTKLLDGPETRFVQDETQSILETVNNSLASENKSALE